MTTIQRTLTVNQLTYSKPVFKLQSYINTHKQRLTAVKTLITTIHSNTHQTTHNTPSQAL